MHLLAMTQNGPLLPAWLVLPMSGAVMAVVWWHASSMLRSKDIPPSRRRIRLANAAVTLLLVPTLGIGFSVVHTSNPTPWAMAWTAAIALLLLTLVLALLDAMNNIRLHSAERQELGNDLRRIRAAYRDHIRAGVAPDGRTTAGAEDRGE